jgi:hypothetical protein
MVRAADGGELGVRNVENIAAVQVVDFEQGCRRAADTTVAMRAAVTVTGKDARSRLAPLSGGA